MSSLVSNGAICSVEKSYDFIVSNRCISSIGYCEIPSIAGEETEIEISKLRLLSELHRMKSKVEDNALLKYEEIHLDPLAKRPVIADLVSWPIVLTITS